MVKSLRRKFFFNKNKRIGDVTIKEFPELERCIASEEDALNSSKRTKLFTLEIREINLYL